MRSHVATFDAGTLVKVILMDFAWTTRSFPLHLIFSLKVYPGRLGESLRRSSSEGELSRARHSLQVRCLRPEQILVGYVDDASPLSDGERARPLNAERYRRVRLGGRFRDSAVASRDPCDFYARWIRERLLPAGRYRRHRRRGCPILRSVERQRDVQL